MQRFYYSLLSFFFLGALSLNAQFYYGSSQEFGKNRIQFQDFEWTYMPFERFQIYVAEGGQEIGRYVSVFLQRNLNELNSGAGL
jgi:hypothetical protein